MKKTPILIAAAAVLALGLTGCIPTPPAPAPKPVETQKSQAPEPKKDEPVASGDSPEWAEGALEAGDKVGELTTDSWQVDIYQVGIAVTDKDSMFVDKETNENLLPSGSEVVYVNFVFTNISDEDIPLSISLGSPSLRTASWKYLGGQPGFSSEAAYENLGISPDGRLLGFEAPFIVAPGQSFSQATNIAYVPGDATEAEVGLIPVDDSDNLLHDLKEEGTTVITIK